MCKQHTPLVCLINVRTYKLCRRCKFGELDMCVVGFMGIEMLELGILGDNHNSCV